MRRFIKIILIIIVIAVVIVLGKKLFSKPHQEGGIPGMGGGAAPVSVAEVLEKEVQQWNEFSGRLAAVNQADIRPRVGGTIDTINFQEGAIVKKGDLLFNIDPRPYAAEVARAEGAYSSAEASVNLARTEANRGKRLINDKAIPQREYDEKINALKVAEANIKTAKAGLDMAKLNLEYSRIKAPVSGRISRAEVTVGNMVEAGNGAPILTTIISNNPIYADFEVDEQIFLTYLGQNATGYSDAKKIPVMMQLDKEGSVMQGGVIQSFDNRLNPQSGTIRVRAAFENADGALVPGLFAKILLGDAAKEKVVLITDRAVGTDQSKKFVFVVGSDNKAAYREIKLGGMVDGLRVVKNGLQPGEKIIVNGLQRARPGSPVTPEVVAMDAKEEQPQPEKPEAPAK